MNNCLQSHFTRKILSMSVNTITMTQVPGPKLCDNHFVPGMQTTSITNSHGYKHFRPPSALFPYSSPLLSASKAFSSTEAWRTTMISISSKNDIGFACRKTISIYVSPKISSISSSSDLNCLTPPRRKHYQQAIKYFQ